MAGCRFFGPTGPVSIGSGLSKTLGQVVAGTNTRIKVGLIDVTFSGATSTDIPVRVQVLKQTDAGSGSSSMTLAKDGDYAETLQSSGIVGPTSAPTDSTVFYDEYVHPQGGRIPIRFYPPKEVPGGTRLAVKVTASTLATTINGAATYSCEE